MGDVDRGRADVLVQAAQLDPNLGPEIGVEIGERLIEQEHLGLAHDRPADGDPLGR